MSALNEKQQEEFDKCLSVYRSPGTRTSRGTSEKSWLKHVIPLQKEDPDLPDKIFQWIISFNLYQKEVGESIQFNRGFQVFLNNNGWRDEIPSRFEAKEKQESALCPCCKEEGKIKIQNKSFCEKYYRNNLMSQKERGMLKYYIKKYNLIRGDETSQEFQQRCKESTRGKTIGV